MGKVIWTNHLRERITQRGLNPDWVDNTVRFPDEIIPGNTPDSKRFIKIFNGYKIIVPVTRQGSDWVIMSAWWNPVQGGQRRSAPQRSFIERIIYNFVLKLEKLITGKK